MIDVAVTGATGRMGREVLAAAAERDDVEVVLAVNRGGAAGDTVASVGGVDIEPASDLEPLLVEREPTVLVDFTGPESSVAYVEACAAASVAAVVGTTGFDEEQEAALRAASETIPVLVAPNFARGVQVLVNVVAEAVTSLPDYDVEVTETHHNRKRDAPSGTANRILDAIEDQRAETQRAATERVHGREGEARRQPGEIGVHARRAGDVTGEHEVLLAGNHEEVRLTHRASRRGVFAEGALDAANWLAGREPGWYDFAEVLGT